MSTSQVAETLLCKKTSSTGLESAWKEDAREDPVVASLSTESPVIESLMGPSLSQVRRSKNKMKASPPQGFEDLPGSVEMPKAEESEAMDVVCPSASDMCPSVVVRNTFVECTKTLSQKSVDSRTDYCSRKSEPVDFKPEAAGRRRTLPEAMAAFEAMESREKPMTRLTSLTWLQTHVEDGPSSESVSRMPSNKERASSEMLTPRSEDSFDLPVMRETALNPRGDGKRALLRNLSPQLDMDLDFCQTASEGLMATDSRTPMMQFPCTPSPTVAYSEAKTVGSLALLPPSTAPSKSRRNSRTFLQKLDEARDSMEAKRSRSSDRHPSHDWASTPHHEWAQTPNGWDDAPRAWEDAQSPPRAPQKTRGFMEASMWNYLMSEASIEQDAQAAVSRSAFAPHRNFQAVMDCAQAFPPMMPPSMAPDLSQMVHRSQAPSMPPAYAAPMMPEPPMDRYGVPHRHFVPSGPPVIAGSAAPGHQTSAEVAAAVAAAAAASGFAPEQDKRLESLAVPRKKTRGGRRAKTAGKNNSQADDIEAQKEAALAAHAEAHGPVERMQLPPGATEDDIMKICVDHVDKAVQAICSDITVQAQKRTSSSWHVCATLRQEDMDAWRDEILRVAEKELSIITARVGKKLVMDLKTFTAFFATPLGFWCKLEPENKDPRGEAKPSSIHVMIRAVDASELAA